MNRAMRAGLVVTGLLLVGACGEGESATAPTTSVATTSVTTTTVSPTTASSASVLPAFPPERRTLEHGGTTWAVVLAAAPDSSGPELQAAVDAMVLAGYSDSHEVRFYAGDCDVGAPEALGVDPDYWTVSVYFVTEDEARSALQAFHEQGYEHGVVAQIVTYCLD